MSNALERSLKPVPDDATNTEEAQPEADTGQDTATLIQITSSGPSDANLQLTLRNASPVQLWAAGRLLQNQGDSIYAQAEMQRFRDRMAANAPQDHKPKRNRKGAN